MADAVPDVPTRYRQKPVEITAIEWTGDNLQAIQAFLGAAYIGLTRFDGRLWLVVELEPGRDPDEVPPGWTFWRDRDGVVSMARSDRFAEIYEPQETTP